LFEYSLRSPNVCGLTRLVTTGEHHDEDLSASSEVQAISRTEIHPHLGNLATHRLPIAQVASLGLTKARGDPDLRPTVIQLIKPLLELGRQLDREHEPIVSIQIRTSTVTPAPPIAEHR
jgi:hypothetical protein